jgi:hypothetical protein
MKELVHLFCGRVIDLGIASLMWTSGFVGVLRRRARGRGGSLLGQQVNQCPRTDAIGWAWHVTSASSLALF